VIRREEGPFEFKIHIFLDSNQDDENNSTRDITLKIMEKLNNMGAKRVQDTFMKNRGEKGSDKIRLIFEIDDRDKALECYRYFIKRHENMNKRGGDSKTKYPEDLDIT
jgi:hypothetical protein